MVIKSTINQSPLASLQLYGCQKGRLLIFADNEGFGVKKIQHFPAIFVRCHSLAKERISHCKSILIWLHMNLVNEQTNVRFPLL